MDTGQQHPDKEECHRGQRKIGKFGRKISKNMAVVMTSLLTIVA
jgi:hypothetical protein